MKKRYIVNFAICIGTMLLSFGCEKDSEKVEATYKDKDYFAVYDLPGEYNQLRYKMYNDYGCTILTTDTLGYTENNEPILFDYRFLVFSEPFSGTPDVKPVYNNLGEEQKIKFIKAFEKWVAPFYPENKNYRYKVAFLSEYMISESTIFPYVYYTNTDYFKVENLDMVEFKDAFMEGEGNITMTISDELKELDYASEKWGLFMNKFLINFAFRWLNTNRPQQISDFSYVDYAYDMYPYALKWVEVDADGNKNYFENDSYDHFYTKGFLRLFQRIYAKEDFVISDEPNKVYLLDGFLYHNGITGTNGDVMDYISYYYLYLGREDEFDAKFAEYSTILTKMKIIREIMPDYFKAAGVKLP